MNYQLDYINSLYKNISTGLRLAKEKQKSILVELEEECGRVLLSLQHCLGSSVPENLQIGFSQHQNDLLLIYQGIHLKMENPNSPSKEAGLPFLTECVNIIRDLIFNLEIHFPKFWDKSLQVPQALLNDFIRSNENKISSLLALSQRISPDDKLHNVLDDLFLFRENPKKAVCFYQLDYLLAVLDILNRENEIGKIRSWKDLVNLLIECNLNSPLFHKTCCEIILSRLDTAGSLRDQFELLSRDKKELIRLSPCLSSSLRIDLPLIKESLLKFVEAELCYLREIEGIASSLSANGIVQDDYMVSLSVKQLAFFIHLQVECGIILETRPKQIRQHVTSHYSTAEVENISEKSFKNAYYSHSQQDINKVSEKLSKMLAISQGME